MSYLTDREREAAAARAEQYPPGQADVYIAHPNADALQFIYPRQAAEWLAEHPEWLPHG